MNAMTEHKPKPAVEFRDGLQKMDGQFQAALPPHIPVERFMRVVQTAVTANDDLLHADRRSLFESAMKAAQDGLLPDGRDGALVIYNTKEKGRDGGKDRWIKKVQWMPMIGGILKKIRNSGELVSIAAHVVYDRDDFTYILGDEERIEHAPALSDRGKPRLVYAIAKTKDGGIYREIMTVEDIEKVRSVSRAKDSGPWVQWWDEMARKTVLRRLAKRLPMSSDLDDLVRRDDALFDFDSARTPQRLASSGLAARLTGRSAPGFDAQHVERETAALDRPRDTTPAHDGDGVIEGEAPSDDAPEPLDEPGEEDPSITAARTKGAMAGAQGRPKKAPNDLGPAEADAWIEGYEAARSEAEKAEAGQ